VAAAEVLVDEIVCRQNNHRCNDDSPRCHTVLLCAMSRECGFPPGGASGAAFPLPASECPCSSAFHGGKACAMRARRSLGGKLAVLRGNAWRACCRNSHTCCGTETSPFSGDDREGTRVRTGCIFARESSG
jgi:hypothetical protein